MDRECPTCQARLQAMETLAPVTADVVDPNPFDYAMAIRMWLRQVHLHATLYKWLRTVDLLAIDSAPPGRKGDLAGAMERADEEMSRKKFLNSLKGPDRLKNEILRAMPISFLTSDIRKKVRNVIPFKGLPNLAGDIQEACDDLCRI
eukprot:11375043-Heterocapsa_arctica.AAC.1